MDKYFDNYLILIGAVIKRAMKDYEIEKTKNNKTAMDQIERFLRESTFTMNVGEYLVSEVKR